MSLSLFLTSVAPRQITGQTTGTITSGGAVVSRAGLIAPLVCVLFGGLISVMPHLVWGGVWIADNDEFLYLSYAGPAYFDHPAHLDDPATSMTRPTFYPWLQMVPGILAAKSFALGPLGISVVWRIWAGISIGVGWYLLASFYTRRPWVALALTLFLLADVGVLVAQPLLRQFLLTIKILLGQAHGVLDTSPSIHPQWRIITPGLSLGYLLLHIWLIARARELPTQSRIILAGLGFGLLFYTYLYYWTAAALALLIAFLLETGKRKVYLGAGWIGVLAGAPALLSSFFLKRLSPPDWLLRTELGLHIPGFSELLFPKAALLLLVVLFVWIWKRRRDLIYVWALAASALLLLNHQMFTSMQTQNFHWTYVWGPCLTFLIVLVAADIFSRTARLKDLPSVRLCLVLVLVLHLGVGMWLRAVEAGKTRESVSFTTTYRQYRDQQVRFPDANLMARTVVAGDKDFVDLAVVLNNVHPLNHYAVLMSPWIDNSEWDYRIALNQFLLGLDRPAFAQAERSTLAAWVWGPEARDPAQRAARLASRLKKYDEITANPGAAIRRSNVKYVALRKGTSTLPPYLQSGWREIEDGPFWQVWELQ